MRFRSPLTSVIAVPAASAAVFALTATGASAAAPSVDRQVGTCSQRVLDVSASPAGEKNTVDVQVTNRGGGTCAVEYAPTVTFTGLDGSAESVPPGPGARYVLSPNESAYAAVRTADPDDSGSGHVVRSMTVAGDPSHSGATFGAADVGMPRGIPVWIPLTTWWQGSQAAADRALDGALG